MPLSAKSSKGSCSLMSPSVVQWDAMTVFMECVVSQILKTLPEEVSSLQSNGRTFSFFPQIKCLFFFLSLSCVQKLPVDQSMELLQAVLNYDTKDPLILSCVLTTVSILLPFLVHRQQLVPQVLLKVSLYIHFKRCLCF